MTIELQALVWTAVILFFSAGVQGMLTPINQGLVWGLGARDEPRDLSVLQGRMRRAVANHIEWTVVFAVLVVVAHLAGISTARTETGAILFAVSRLAYVPVYAAGVPYLRTAVWTVGTVGLVLIAIDVLGAALTGSAA
ncbi:MAG: MAPEG family protein [Pseudomonadota bacterium]